MDIDKIDEKYLFNFSAEEKDLFRAEVDFIHRVNKAYRNAVDELFKMRSSELIPNSERPFSFLEIKYYINRIAMNDPDLTSLYFHNDSVSRSQFKDLGNAFKTNTKCKNVNLSGTKMTRDDAFYLIPWLSKKDISLNISCNNLGVFGVRAFLEDMLKPSNAWRLIDISNSGCDQKTLNFYQKRLGERIICRRFGLVNSEPEKKSSHLLNRLLRKGNGHPGR